jgi:hypothetical protein
VAAVVLAARREDELQAQARQLRYMTGQVVVVDGGYIAL